MLEHLFYFGFGVFIGLFVSVFGLAILRSSRE